MSRPHDVLILESGRHGLVSDTAARRTAFGAPRVQAPLRYVGGPGALVTLLAPARANRTVLYPFASSKETVLVGFFLLGELLHHFGELN